MPGQDAVTEMAAGQELIGVALIGCDHHVRAGFLTEPRSGERAPIAQLPAAWLAMSIGKHRLGQPRPISDIFDIHTRVIGAGAIGGA